MGQARGNLGMSKANVILQNSGVLMHWFARIPPTLSLALYDRGHFHNSASFFSLAQ